MNLIEVKTVKITSKGQIAIPKDIRELEGFEEGEKIAILAYSDHLELRPLGKIKKLLKGSVATAILSEKSLAKDWEGYEEDNAWKDL